jgi:hypothetical protein
MAAIEGIDGVRGGSSGNSRADAWKMAQAFMDQGASADKTGKAGDKKGAEDPMADNDGNGIPDVIDALPLTDEEKQQLLEMMGMNGAQVPKEEGSGGGGGGDKGGGGGGGDKAGGCPKSGGGGGGSPQGAGGGGGPQGAGGGGGPQGPGANNLKAGDAGSGNSKVDAGPGGSATVDVDNDGNADVKVTGKDAGDLAKIVKDMADKNPEMKQKFLDQKTGDKPFEINISDQGTKDGKEVMGRAGLGAKGKINVDDNWKSHGTLDAKDTVAHELRHTLGEKDGPTLEAEAAADAAAS